MQRKVLVGAATAAILASGLVGCGGGPRRVVASGPAADVRPAAERRCAHWIVGASAATAERRFLVLGGGYGTAETPRFVADLLCQLGAKGPVVLALAWPRPLASEVGLFLAGSMTAAARLRANALWTDPAARSEGRATAAMWQLLEQLRALRAAGVELAVVPFAADLAGGSDDSSERWYAQSAISSAVRRYADSTFVVWVEEAEGEYAIGESDTIAASLRAQYEKLRSFKLEALSAAPASDAARADAPALAVAAAPWALELRGDVERYDGVFRLGQTSRSPALESEPAAAVSP